MSENLNLYKNANFISVRKYKIQYEQQYTNLVISPDSLLFWSHVYLTKKDIVMSQYISTTTSRVQFYYQR